MKNNYLTEYNVNKFRQRRQFLVMMDDFDWSFFDMGVTTDDEVENV